MAITPPVTAPQMDSHRPMPVPKAVAIVGTSSLLSPKRSNMVSGTLCEQLHPSLKCFAALSGSVLFGFVDKYSPCIDASPDLFFPAWNAVCVREFFQKLNELHYKYP
jgi:hypothetical protein